jgi:hypothetical protein
LCWLFFCNIRILISPLVSSYYSYKLHYNNSAPMSTFSLLCLMSVETVCYFFMLWSPIVSLTKYRVTRTPLKIGGECICSERVSSSCSNSGTRRVNLVTKPVINHERGKDLGVITTSGTYQIYLYVLYLCFVDRC